MALKRSLEEYITDGPFAYSPLMIYPTESNQTEFYIGIELDSPESSFLVINGEVFPYGYGYTIQSNTIYLSTDVIGFSIETDDAIALYI